MADIIWREVHEGGSPEAEREIFLSLARDMLAIQEANRVKSGAGHPGRTLHAKMVAGVTNAVLTVDDALPESFAASYFRPGTSISATVRFSNASGIAQADGAPDMRGAALKLAAPGGPHDLLMTSFPVSHARNARQFVEFAVIASGGRETMAARLTEKFGDAETRRMMANIMQGMAPCPSLALQRFWSRGAVLWAGRPVRFDLRPAPGAEPAISRDDGSDSLRSEFAARLSRDDVTYRLALQPFVDEETTPIEDGSVEWREEISAPVEVASLVIPRQDLLDAAGRAQAEIVDGLAFNPWNAPPEFRPLGNLNRARGAVYGASAQAWQASRKSIP